MEQHKLEKQFKEKLSNREINPSGAAWDRLDAMLSIAESKTDTSTKQKSNRKFIWLYVAASIMGILFVGNLILNPKETLIQNPENNVVIIKKSTRENEKIETTSPTKQLNADETIAKQRRAPLVQTVNRKNSTIKNPIINAPEEIVAESKQSNHNESIILNKSGSTTNIDSLLASVEKPALTAKKSGIKINSSALLNQVDGEVQLSFREKALHTITKKYKEAKEALANRNNQ
jgi:hypothetical protein